MINENKRKDNYLTVILDDNDEVLESIETAFKDNNVKKAVLISSEGKLKNVRVAISIAGSIRQRIYSEPLRIKSVSGEFYKVKDDYLGDVHICLEKDNIHTITGVLFKGYADNEARFKFKIISNVNFGINHNKPITLVKQKVLDEVNKKPKPIIEA